jgi:AmmeMemoRadiSam system protein A
MELSETNRSVLLDLARERIRQILSTASVPDSNTCEPADPELLRAAGCFVSLHEAGTHRLRGCVGRLDATQPIWLAVQQAAESALNDPRFSTDPVTLAELSNLEIEITLISPLTPARDAYDFDLEQHGVYLTLGGHSGCFLPQVARETGWSRQHLLERLCTEKLGLPASSWQDPQAVLQRFTAQIIGPVSF